MRLVAVVLSVGGFLALAGSTGCTEGLAGGYGLDPDVVQDVLDYRESVFDSANNAWDEYIRM